MSTTPGTYTNDAISHLNQQLGDVVNTTILYRQRNLARRQYTGEYAWSWASNPTTLTFEADVTFTTLFSATAPTDIDYRHIPKLWVVNSGTVDEFIHVDFSKLFETTQENRFWVDENNGKIYSNVEGTVYALYQQDITDLPENATLDAVAEPFSSGTAITWLLSSFYVLATRQEMGTSEFFNDKYSAQLEDDIAKEQGKQPLIKMELPVTRKR